MLSSVIMQVLLLAVVWFAFTSCGDDTVLPEFDDEAVVFADDADDPHSSPTSYIVTFRSESARTAQQFISFAQEAAAHLVPLRSRLVAERGLLDMQHLAAVSLTPELEYHRDVFSMPLALRRQWTERPGQTPIGSITQVDFASEDDARRVLNLWNQRKMIWFAEPNGISQLHNSFGDYVPAFEGIQRELYWHESVRALEAIKWLADNRTLQAQPIVAILDSGVDPEHPALRDRMWRNEAVGAADCANDLYGCNTTAGQRDLLGNGDISPLGVQEDGTCPESKTQEGRRDGDCSHGTHVAGIVAGLDRSGSDYRFVGICPMCRIMAVKIVSHRPTATSIGTILDASIIRGLHYVGRFRTGQGAGVRVINASFGKYQRSRAVGVLIRNLHQNGTLVVAAAGNEDAMATSFPAGFRDVVAVSNIGSDGQKHQSSNFGAWVDIAAPGGDILSAIPGTRPPYESKNGTSMAAPIVAGVAGLMLAAQPDLSAQYLRDTLIRTANPNLYATEREINRAYYVKVSGRAERIPLLGSGMVDALAAVKGEANTGIPTNINARRRVDSACGITGHTPRHDTAAKLLFALLLLWPLTVFVSAYRMSS